MLVLQDRHAGMELVGEENIDYDVAFQHDAIAMETNGHLPLNIKLLPQYLNRHGYFSYMVGK